MAQLPAGTVTFLFTDIEGSTKLLQRLGPEYARAMGEQWGEENAGMRAVMWIWAEPTARSDGDAQR